MVIVVVKLLLAQLDNSGAEGARQPAGRLS
jgi:hypothetical protein